MEENKFSFLEEPLTLGIWGVIVLVIYLLKALYYLIF